MRQVFAVEGVTARFERGGDDERIVEAESVAGLQVEATLVQHQGRVDPPKRYQRVVQYLSGFLRRCIEFSDYDVNRLLNNLITDATGFVHQGLLNQTNRSPAFMVIGFIKQINENIGVEEVFNAHSFRPE